MIAITKPERQDAPTHENEQFLKFVPDIERYARWLLRDLRAEEREEAVCEVLAFAFCAFRCLARHGKRDLAYATPLARFGVARFRCGRRSYSKRIGRDVFSHVVQRRRGFSLQSLHSADSRGNIWLEILADDTVTPVPAQVAFRLDFASWLRSLKCRDRKLVKLLAVGNTPGETAKRLRISRARVSQLRSQLQDGWRKFQGEPDPGTKSLPSNLQKGAAQSWKPSFLWC